MSNKNNVVVTIDNNVAKVTSKPTTTRVSTSSQTGTAENVGAKVVTASIDNSTATSTGVGVKGDAGLVFKGAFLSTNNYNSGDLVTFGGSTYVTPSGVVAGGSNPDSSSDWTLFASKGEVGEKGAASTIEGKMGDKGDQGDPFEYSDFTQGQLKRFTGPKGNDGVGGQDGQDGQDGAKGDEGTPGNRGDTGLRGPEGQDGQDGSDGLDGAKGDTGDASTIPGPEGPEGSIGDKGDQGDPFKYSDFNSSQLNDLKGDKGEEGDEGPKGLRGPQGIEGDASTVKGPRGDTGIKGPDGDPFVYTDFSQDQLDDLKGDKGDPGDEGIQGIEGLDGSDGDPGIKGDRGDAGNPGLRGPEGDRGPRGTEGNPGLRGPGGQDGSDGGPGVKGEEGDRGPEGPLGDPFEFSDFTTDQLESIRGTRGEPGDNGRKGDQGLRGFTHRWRTGALDPYSGFTSGGPGDFYFETDSKRFWEFKAGASQQPGGEWVEIASLPGQFADTPNRGNVLGVDFDTSAGVVRGTVDATAISGSGGTSTSVGILDLPGLNATAINSNITLTDGRCSGLNDLGDNDFLDAFESEGSCLADDSNNTWTDLPVGTAFLTKELGTHVVTDDELISGISGLLQVSLLSVEGVDLSTINFTIELGGAIQTFTLPDHGGVVSLDFTQEKDSEGNVVVGGFDRRPTSTGLHSLTISKDTGGVVKASMAVVLNNDGGSVIIKPAVEEVLDDQYGLIFKDSPNAERELGVNFTRIDKEDDAYPDGVEGAVNRDILKATVDTRSLNLSVPGFEHSGTTGVTEFFPATNEVNVITYSGTTAASSIGGSLESTIITIGENSISGKLTTTPEFIDISDELTNVTSVAYDGSSLYVAVANNNLLYTSVTGEDWIPSPYNISTNVVASLSSVTYGGGRFIVVGKHTDGDHIIFYTVSIQAPNVVWNFNRFESLAQGGTLDVKYFNSRFWYYGSDTSDESVLLLNSSFADPSNAGLGETSLILDMDGDNISDILIGHHKLGTISYTTGSGWNTTTVSTAAGTGVITSVVYGDSTWFVGTSTGKIFRSTNLTTWTSVGNSSNTSSMEPGVYHDGIFMMPTNNGDVFYSSNATTMTKLSISGVSFVNRAWAGGKRYFLTGTNSTDVFQVARLDDRTEVILTLPDHITNPLTFSITSESNANFMATQIAEAINNANPNNLTMATAGDNRVSFSATVAGNNINGSISLFSHSGVLSPITTFVVTDGETAQSNSIKDTIEFYNLTASFGRNTTLLSLNLDFGLTGDAFRDAIVAALETIGGYTIDITVEGRIITTNTIAGADSDLLIGYNKATEGGSTAIAARSLPLSVKGINAFTDGDLTSLIYTIEDVPYTVTFPSGVATANQQALFARSTINTIRGNPITDDTDFVMSVNGDLLNFRLPEGVSASDHTIALNSPVPDTDPPYSGGTLVNAANPVGTYVLPVIASNVLSLTEFRDTVSTAEYKGVDFTEDKSVVAGKVAYTWNDYTAGGLFQELTTDNSGTTVKLQFSKTDDGLTTAFVYRRIIGAGTTDYSDIVYAEESLTTILATRGG